MNAYELADSLAFKYIDGDISGAYIAKLQNMLYQQADRIAELEKDLHMVQRHYDQLDTNAKPVAMRYGYDGNGYLYIDEGSGSDWKARIKDAEPLYTAPQTKPLKFPTMLRKMWSGGEVQEWLDKNQAPQTKPLTDEEICKLFNEHTGLGVHQKEAGKADLLVFARAIEAKIRGEG